MKLLAGIALLSPLAAFAGTADAPKIQVLKQSNETLWQFLAALPASMEAQIFYGFMLAAFIGMVGSWLYKWTRKEVGGLVSYMFVDYVRNTVGAVLGITVLSCTAIGMNMFVTDDGTFVGWLNVLGFGLSTGFNGDIVANKGQPKS